MVTSVPGRVFSDTYGGCVCRCSSSIPSKRVVAAVHAGWRGSVKLIARKTVEILNKEFNCKPGDLLVGIGPSIGPCHYEIGPDVIAHVKGAFGGTEDYIKDESS